MANDEFEVDEDAFLYDGRRITVLRGQHPGNFYGAHAFFLAQRYAYRESSSILRDEEGYPMVAFLHTPRGEEHNHDATLAAVEWVLARLLRGLINRALRMSKGPIRVALTGFGPYEDQSGLQIPHNVTGEFAEALGRIRGTLKSALPDKLAPMNRPEKPHPTASEGDLALFMNVYDPGYRLGRPLTVFSRVLSVDERALGTNPESSLTGMLEFYRPQLYVGLSVRERGMPEFVIEEVSDDSGLTERPSPQHLPEKTPTTGHPLNRAAARSFELGVQELGGMADDQS